ncbi:MAG: phospho-N-acetylmuramoyl-pentapeptide-transferase [Leptospiraceae bacterium]|nr:phospho-N-acetylmuramoyl-pentapeptide-transferase [Leptospiraceae bacterium]
MFEFIYSHFEVPGFFRLFGYVSFRALLAGLGAMLFSFAIGDRMIRYLFQLKFKETIREDGPDSHQVKQGTPTMGGLLILLCLALASLLFGNWGNLHFMLLLLCTLLFGAIGFMDDYAKVVLGRKNGMNARMKMILTLLVAFAFCAIYYIFTPLHKLAAEGQSISYNTTSLFLPFYKGPFVDLWVWVAFPFWILVIVGSSHAVNLTDGLDGLAIGNVSIVAVTFGIMAYITGTPIAADYLNLPAVPDVHELSVFMAALTGAGVGFLWFNCSPARIFMGDTGSLALGAALGMVAIIIKKEFLLVLAGGVFVAEALSVIIQVGSYKLRKKRVFRMAPLHHHFELQGWPETRVVIRFWLVGIILALLTLSTLRIQ